MAKTYSSLPILPLTTEASFCHPPEPPEIIHLDDHALDILTDLNRTYAVTTSPEATIPEATLEMRVCHTHMLLVVNRDNKIIGMITTEDLLGEKLLKVIQEKQIRRSEILVRMVMTRYEDIVALDLNDLHHAKIGNVVTTLHEAKQHYALVIESNDVSGEAVVRGLFSLWDISRRVGEDLTYDISEAHSLAELQKGLGKK